MNSFASPLRLRLAAAFAGVLALAGCAEGGPPATFNLSAPTEGFRANAARRVLSVDRPTADAPADTDRVVVRTGGGTIAYLRGAQWVEALPALVQDRLIESFENAHLVRKVVRPGDNINADDQLVTEIRRFDIDAGTGLARAEISAKLVSVSTGRIVAGRIFVGQATGSAKDPASATRALNQALDQVMRQIVDWAASARA